MNSELKIKGLMGELVPDKIKSERRDSRKAGGDLAAA